MVKAARAPLAMLMHKPEKTSSTTLHAHGDGTYHTESGYGDRTEHPTIGHALMFMAAKHSEGNHVHIHQDGGLQSHTMKSGKVTGPHDHKNMEALKTSLGKFLDEEESEK